MLSASLATLLFALVAPVFSSPICAHAAKETGFQIAKPYKIVKSWSLADTKCERSVPLDLKNICHYPDKVGKVDSQLCLPPGVPGSPGIGYSDDLSLADFTRGTTQCAGTAEISITYTCGAPMNKSSRHHYHG